MGNSNNRHCLKTNHKIFLFAITFELYRDVRFFLEKTTNIFLQAELKATLLSFELSKLVTYDITFVFRFSFMLLFCEFLTLYRTKI